MSPQHSLAQWTPRVGDGKHLTLFKPGALRTEVLTVSKKKDIPDWVRTCIACQILKICVTPEKCVINHILHWLKMSLNTNNKNIIIIKYFAMLPSPT